MLVLSRCKPATNHILFGNVPLWVCYIDRLPKKIPKKQPGFPAMIRQLLLPGGAPGISKTLHWQPSCPNLSSRHSSCTLQHSLSTLPALSEHSSSTRTEIEVVSSWPFRSLFAVLIFPASTLIFEGNSAVKLPLPPFEALRGFRKRCSCKEHHIIM